jgi:hypothetical protein
MSTSVPSGISAHLSRRATPRGRLKAPSLCSGCHGLFHRLRWLANVRVSVAAAHNRTGGRRPQTMLAIAKSLPKCSQNSQPNGVMTHHPGHSPRIMEGILMASPAVRRQYPGNQSLPTPATTSLSPDLKCSSLCRGGSHARRFRYRPPRTLAQVPDALRQWRNGKPFVVSGLASLPAGRTRLIGNEPLDLCTRTRLSSVGCHSRDSRTACCKQSS